MRLLAVVGIIVALVGCVTVVAAPEGKGDRCNEPPRFVRGLAPALALPQEDPDGSDVKQLEILVLQLGHHAREWRTYSENERQTMIALMEQHHRDCH